MKSKGKKRASGADSQTAKTRKLSASEPGSKADLDLVFEALGDATRRAMLERLSAGSMSVTVLAKPFDMSLAAAMQHLGILEEAGLVKTEKLGRVRNCRIESASLVAAEEWLRARRPEWDSQIDQLAAHFVATYFDKGNKS